MEQPVFTPRRRTYIFIVGMEVPFLSFLWLEIQTVFLGRYANVSSFINVSKSSFDIP
jgi:hypothetical protein